MVSAIYPNLISNHYMRRQNTKIIPIKYTKQDVYFHYYFKWLEEFS